MLVLRKLINCDTVSKSSGHGENQLEDNESENKHDEIQSRRRENQTAHALTIGHMHEKQPVGEPKLLTSVGSVQR